MLFVVDLDSLELISAATDRSPVVSVQGKRGDETPFEVIFVRSGVAEELPTSTVLTFGAKPAGKYDDAAVVLSSDFTLSGTGTAAKYLGSPSFNTAELNALFLIDGDETNDPAYIDLMAEFTWQIGSGAPTSTKTFAFRVHNDVVRDAESSPTPIPTPIGTTAPVNAVTGVSQVETITHAGNCTGSGTLVVDLVSTWLTRTYNVAITSGDTPSVWGSKIRVVLNADTDFINLFTIGFTLSSTTITKTVPAANDATFNISVALGTATGVTAAPTSANTTAGVAAVAATVAPPYLRTAGGFLYVQEAGVWKKTALSAL